ncbi:MAG: glycosyl hydrolase [Anaerohalosphaeraceae bacterium]
MKKMLFLAVLFTSVPAYSATITLVAADALGQSSFNSGLNWSNGQPPSAGNDYVVSIAQLRTPPDGGNYVFGGDSLTINTGGVLMYKGTGSTGSITVNNLIGNGGTIIDHRNGAADVCNLYGNIHIAADSMMYAKQGPINVYATISGSARITNTGSDGDGRTLTFYSSANTFTGSIVNNGRFVLADDAVLRFVIGANGVNNSISGTGPQTVLNGDFIFDLNGAGTSVGDSWTIVSASNRTFGATFTVVGFTNKGGGVWEKEANGVLYQFDQSTGKLTVIPSSTTLYIDNSIQTYGSLSNATVYMTGTSELHLTGTTPLTNSVVHLNSADAWLFFRSLKPSAVNTSTYLNQIRVNGAAAVLNTNIRIVQYEAGTVVIPHSSSYQALQVFSNVNFTGSSVNLGNYTYYRSTQLGAMNNNIRSFRLKRGYMATFAANDNGTGPSRVYVAKDADLWIGVMPADLENDVSFVRVIPWRWPSKKGWCGSASDAAMVNCTWRYDWDNAATSTLDIEYVPMRHNANWNSYSNINNKQNSTHVLAFNEPDKSDQANMTVQQVIDAWPNLVASGLRLGSPAPSDASSGLDWLYSFIDQADALGLRVDFVAVHYYKNNWTADQLENWLRGIHQRTGRPLWITEFNNGCNWTTPHPTYEQNAAKINELITRMASLPYVERYSIYQWCTNRELIVDGALTPAGVVYRDHLPPMANSLDVNFECIGYYRLDEQTGTTAGDLSGKGRNGTLMGGLNFASNSAPGVLGRALQFDGTDDYIQLPSGFYEFDNGFSVSFWAYPTAVKNYARFVDLGSGPNANNIIVGRYGTTNDLFVQVFNGSSGGTVVRATNALALNAWQHFVVSISKRSSSNVKIYKNGQLILTATTSIPLSATRTANYIGRSNWTADAYYQGLLDDVRIYDYAVTTSEAAALYASGGSRPYTSQPAVIPGRIEAEQYDLGQSGAAYYDTTVGNSGGAFRNDGDVDIRSISDFGSGFAVTNIAAGEWLRYTVNVTESGVYCLYLRASATGNNIPVTVKLDNAVVGTVLVNSTGSLDTFGTFLLNNLTLEAGAWRVLELSFSSPGLEVNWVEFQKQQSPWGGTAWVLPGRVEAEDFDFGGPGYAYWDTTAGNSGGAYRTYESVDIVAVTDGTAGYAVDSIESGEWLTYTVSTSAAVRDLYVRLASIQDGGQIRVWLDADLLATVTVPNTGSLDAWRNVIVPGVVLPQKTNAILKLEFIGSGYRVNWIDFQNRMPYLGVPVSLPGILEFENFDVGGNYVSYFDNTPGNSYGAYRTDVDVDIMTIWDGGAGFGVYMESGEWLEYTCSMPAGLYDLRVRYTTNYPVDSLQLADGTTGTVLANLVLASTGGWSSWQDAVIEGIYLPGGPQSILRFVLGSPRVLVNYVEFIRRYNPADLNRSGLVDLEDFSILSSQWLGEPGDPSADTAPAGGDGWVDLEDLADLADNWLIWQ